MKREMETVTSVPIADTIAACEMITEAARRRLHFKEQPDRSFDHGMKSPTIGELEDLELEATRELRASGLAPEKFEGITGHFFLQRPRSSLRGHAAWKVSVLFSEGLWRLQDISIIADQNPCRQQIVLNMTEDRIADISAAGRPIDHYGRLKQVTVTSTLPSGKFNTVRSVWAAPRAWQRS